MRIGVKDDPTGKSYIYDSAEDLAQDINYLIEELQGSNYGNISITSRYQENGPYITIAGLGVQVGGYKTFAKALRAWRETKELDAKMGNFDPEREHQKLFEELNS